jgi:guanylate kinase
LNTSLTGALFVMVGPSGVGKNVVMKQIMERMPMLRQMPTATTRAMREGEQEGREHFFVSLKQFEQMKVENALIEYEEVYAGTWYGTPRQGLQNALASGDYLIADIDVHGAKNLKEAFPDNVVLIFIAPPSLDDLEKRLRQRGKMDEAEIARRLNRAPEELAFAEQCDYRVVNDELEKTIEQVMGIINAELLNNEQA